MKHCRITNYTLPLPVQACSEDPSGEGLLRIAFFSDLHGCCSERETEEFFRLLHRIRPDLVLCGGDSIVAKPEIPMDSSIAFLCRIAQEFPLFIGTGNHEFRTKLYPESYGSMYEEFCTPVRLAGAC